MKHTKNLTIFEGPDGSGKTTQARRFARRTDAKYVHFGAMTNVDGEGLIRMYVEAMLPALLGYQDIVFDRSWLSEEPYGKAYRGGVLRLNDHQLDILERLAMKCGAVVVRCKPSWETVKTNFSSGRPEYLDTVDQLKEVYDTYSTQVSSLPQIIYNYELEDEFQYYIDSLIYAIGVKRAPNHFVDMFSAGDFSSDTVVITEKPLHQLHDNFYQWPKDQLSTSVKSILGTDVRRMLWCDGATAMLMPQEFKTVITLKDYDNETKY